MTKQLYRSRSATKILLDESLFEEIENKVIVHLLPDSEQENYGNRYWKWLLDDDGLYGRDGKNGLIILDNHDGIYKNYTQFSNFDILEAFDLAKGSFNLDALAKLTGKKYDFYSLNGYNQGDIFKCYYPVGEFTTEWLQELGCVALGMYTIYEVQDNDDYKYDTTIDSTVLVIDNGIPAKEQIAETIGVKPQQIVIRKPVQRWDYEEEEIDESLSEDIAITDTEAYTSEDYLKDVVMGHGYVTLDKIEMDIKNNNWGFNAIDVIHAASQEGWIITKIDGEYATQPKNFKNQSLKEDKQSQINMSFKDEQKAAEERARKETIKRMIKERENGSLGDRIKAAELKQELKEDYTDEDNKEVIPDSVTPGPEAGIASQLNKLIIDEWEAIQGYNDAIVMAELEGFHDVAKVFNDIVNEENLHVGQLEQCLKQVSPSADSINQGEVEAHEQLTESVDPKHAWLKELAQEDWSVGHTFDPNDFNEFKKIAKECGFDVTEKDFDKYFEYIEEI